MYKAQKDVVYLGQALNEYLDFGWRDMKILIADDDDVSRLALEAMLIKARLCRDVGC